MSKPNANLRVAFVVGVFPVISETFIINQIADLLDRGVDVEVFAFEKGGGECISSRYAEYRMSERTHYLQPPTHRSRKYAAAIPKVLRLLLSHPLSLLRSLNIVRYGRQAASLRPLFWAAPFAGKRFDAVHCHFGDVATRFLPIRKFLKLEAPMVTTFYGYDVSRSLNQNQNGGDIYSELKRECSLFLVMSNNMRERVLAHGFSPDQVRVHPVSIDLNSYPFAERRQQDGKAVELVSVGRFVEKKGFDDLLRALALASQQTHQRLRCTIVGGGALEPQLRELTASLGLKSQVDFKGYMRIDDIRDLLQTMHLMVQPSKTASDGDME